MAQSPSVSFSPSYSYPQKIIIGDDIDFPSYSFLDENGNPTGFNIEIARSVARTMGLEIEFRLGEWSSIRRALERGEIDAISGMFYSSERLEIYSFTTRHSVSNGAIFTGRNVSMSSLYDLAGKTVVVQDSDIVAEFLMHQDLDITFVKVATVFDALKLVNDGIYDYAGVLMLPGLHSVKTQQLTNVKNQGLVFMLNDYNMAVRRGNEELLYVLNAGLYALKASDEYSLIYDKWLGVYEEQSFWMVVSRYKWAMIITLSVVGLLVITSVLLNLLVKKRTRQLQKMNKDLLSAHAELLTKNDQLAQSRGKLNEQLLKIQQQGQIIEFKQNFLANMSHEIRTPLTGIIGMSEILNQTSLTHDQKEYVNTLKQSGENLMEIINQVLDYSKIEAGKVQLNKTSFSFNELERSAHNLFKSICVKDITWNSTIDPRIPEMIRADRNRIVQIINNLISNSVKFSQKGQVSMNFLLEKQQESSPELIIKVIVSDSGPGIPEDQQMKLFQPFTQLQEKDNREIDGTGLGLSICKQLAQLHGGEIGMTSEVGKGSSFWFTFLCEKVETPTGMDKSQASKPKETTNRELRILLVEDKPINQKVIKLILTALGHTIDIAENGKRALEIFKPGLFDLILMDIQMPVMDGVTATRELRNLYHENLPPIVGLSANAFEGDREKYIAHGMDEYITKPFKKEEFQCVVNRLFNRLQVNN